MLRRGNRSDDPTPLYFRLEVILRDAINAGEFKAGQALPTERDLGTLYGVSRITVRKALEALERDGLVRKDTGRRGGTFVRDNPSKRPAPHPIGTLDRIVAEGVNRIKVLVFDVRPCGEDVAKLLGLRPSDNVRYFERLISTAAGPIAYVRNHLPLSIGEALTRQDLSKMFLRDVLTSRCGIVAFEVRDDVQAMLADSRIATMLKVRPGSPLLRISRLNFGANRDPVNLSILHIGGPYRIAVTMKGEIG